MAPFVYKCVRIYIYSKMRERLYEMGSKKIKRRDHDCKQYNIIDKNERI